MSALARVDAPRPTPRSTPRPRLEIAPSRERQKARPRAGYAAVAIVSVFAIFGAQLLLSIAVSQGAYEITDLKAAQKDALRSQDALDETLQQRQSTQNLTTQAAHLGMVPNTAPFAIDLNTGAVYALPGSSDPLGCGGGCNLITNSLTSTIPLVSPTPGVAVAPVPIPSALAVPAAATPAPAAATPLAPAAGIGGGGSGSSDSLPAPVTR